MKLNCGSMDSASTPELTEFRKLTSVVFQKVTSSLKYLDLRDSKKKQNVCVFDVTAVNLCQASFLSRIIGAQDCA